LLLSFLIQITLVLYKKTLYFYSESWVKGVQATPAKRKQLSHVTPSKRCCPGTSSPTPLCLFFSTVHFFASSIISMREDCRETRLPMYRKGCYKAEDKHKEKRIKKPEEGID